MVLLGDSITQGAAASGWYTGANMQAGYPTTLLANAGVSGNRTDEMLARLTADVLVYAPDITIVEGGGNDITQGYPASHAISSLDGIYTALAAAGSVIIATTVLPSTNMDTGGEQAAITAVNAWIRANYSSYATACFLCDWNPPMTDGVDEWVPHAGYTSDGVHPNTVGGAVMATALSPVLAAATA